jgi:uncharacterized protein
MRCFVSSMTPDAIQVEPVIPEDLAWVHEILEQYAGHQLDFTDAAVVGIAESLDVKSRLHARAPRFLIIRPSHRDYFELLP